MLVLFLPYVVYDISYYSNNSHWSANSCGRNRTFGANYSTLFQVSTSRYVRGQKVDRVAACGDVDLCFSCSYLFVFGYPHSTASRRCCYRPVSFPIIAAGKRTFHSAASFWDVERQSLVRHQAKEMAKKT